MAAGPFVVLDTAKLHLATGLIDLDSHVFKMALTTSAQALSASFTGASGSGLYADLTAQVANGNGYTTGGVVATLSVARSGGTVTVEADNPAWTGATFTAKYGVIYNDTAAGKPILCLVDLDTANASGVAPVAGTLTVTTPQGLFTLTGN